MRDHPGADLHLLEAQLPTLGVFQRVLLQQLRPALHVRRGALQQAPHVASSFWASWRARFGGYAAGERQHPP
jgi:hypothetical protein